MSLSRKKEDKVNNTARFHIMKNRFGPDGITFPCKMIHLQVILKYIDYNTDLEKRKFTCIKTNKFDTDVDKYDKAALKKAYDPNFFTISNNK